MTRTIGFAILPWLLAFPPAQARAADDFKLVDSDRVVLIGSTLIEREQRYGYWETALTIRFPDKNIQFRNLGWSGDTVWGEARAGFETAKEGYQRLVEKTLALKPTVIIIGYGTNESFAGKAGLQRFQEQLNRLLDDLKPSKARLVLLAPARFEKESWRAGNFSQRAQDLKLYAEAIRQVARKRQAIFSDEFVNSNGVSGSLTDDGMHLTSYGYWITGKDLPYILGFPELRNGAALSISPVVDLVGLSSKKVLEHFVPYPPVPQGYTAPELEYDSSVIAGDLKPGRYTLKIDGQPVQTANAQKWLEESWPGTLVLKGPSLDQAEKLRKVIVEKNRLYFNRWRPQNETYLFGFRKYEQGQNAREIPLFDPLIAKLEKEIARLRKPVAHTYQLVPAGEEKK